MRMDGVVDTDAVIDLAIVFAKEAMDYADASRSNQQSSSEDEPSDENEDDQDSDGGSGASRNDDDNDNAEDQDQSSPGRTSQADPSNDDPAKNQTGHAKNRKTQAKEPEGPG